MDTQQIRRSQFVLTYGPGAILEGKRGPRMILILDNGLGNNFNIDTLLKYEIKDIRSAMAIGSFNEMVDDSNSHERKIFMLPSNDSIRGSGERLVYKTKKFPEWNICYNDHANHGNILYPGSTCPECKDYRNSSAVRFVAACDQGHLDDIDWDYAVHKHRKCVPGYYYWDPKGILLADIKIQCPKCGIKTDMGKIYYISFGCSGRFPENVNLNEQKCDSHMKVMQRQSLSLHMPVIYTLLTIPEFDEPIFNSLQNTVIQSALGGLEKQYRNDSQQENTEAFIEGLKDHTKYAKIDTDVLETIEKYIVEHSIESLYKKMEQISSQRAGKHFTDFINEEFESLLVGPRKSENFEMSDGIKINSITSNGDIPDITVYPVNKIRTVTFQRGYIRMPPDNLHESNQKIVDISREESGISWYPGYEGIGDGIFIKFDRDELLNIKTKHKYTYDGWINNRYEEKVTEYGRNNDCVNNPLFVYMHTLSHSIITTLSLFSGYSSASLKERIYIDTDKLLGGILIYTSTPGEDGSMGGLSSIAGNTTIFGSLLAKALERINVCSNDPLCNGLTKTKENFNGAACYSCLFVSETSCEHGNKYLDRHMVMGDDD